MFFTWCTTSIAFLVAALMASGQQNPDPPRFDVVSIKVDNAGTGGAGDQFPKSGRWHWTRIPLSSLLMYAYDTSLRQVVNIPKSVEGPATAFTIDAKVPPNVTPAQFRGMLQTMLAERFNFQMHREYRDFDVSLVQVAPGGHKLKPASGDCVIAQQPASAEQPWRCGEVALRYSMNDGLRHAQYTGRSARIADLVVELSRNKPLVDETGIDGAWDLDVGFDFETSGPSDDEGGRVARQFAYERAFRDAFLKQAGLLIDLGKQAKRPLPVIVVDHVELPTAN